MPTHNNIEKTFRWKTSTFTSSGDCVEVESTLEGVRVRDTKDGETGGVLNFTASEWTAFLDGAKAGEFDV